MPLRRDSLVRTFRFCRGSPSVVVLAILGLAIGFSAQLPILPFLL